MPENLQGQFEKRLYLNTRIKSGGTYTTEGPHGLAFVEELNNYVTENQNTSITLGSSDHKVSILFDGPSTFVKDGIGISSSVPSATTNRLYNNNGDLYWNGGKLSTDSHNFTHEDSENLWLGSGIHDSSEDTIITGKRSIAILGPNESQIRIANYGISIKTNENDPEATIFIQGPGDSYITLKADETQINNNYVQFGFSDLQTSVIFNGPAYFDSNEVIFNGTVAINGPIRSGLHLEDDTPIDTNYKLYNNNGDLYWNGSKVGGSTFNYIREETDTLYLGSSAKDVTVSGSRSVLIEGPNESQIQLHNYGISIKTNENDPEATIFIQGPGDSGITVASNRTHIYNNFVQFGGYYGYLCTTVIFSGPVTFDGNGVAFKASTLFDGPVTFNGTTAFNGPIKSGLQLDDGIPSATSNRLYNSNGDLYWNGSKVGGSSFNYISEDPGGAYIGSDNCDYVNIKADQVQINGTTIVAGPSEVRFCYTSIIVGPHSIKSCADEIQFGHEGVQATSVLFNGPATFNGSVAINGPINSGLQLDNSIPSVTTNRLYNSSGDLYWNGSKVGGGSSYEHIVEDPNWLYLGWKGSTDTEIDHIQTYGKEVDTYFNSLAYYGPTVLFRYVQNFEIDGPGHSNFVIGPDGIKIASHETIFISGPNAAEIKLVDNGVHLGSESNPCTTTIEGPSHFKNTLELKSLSSHPSDRSYKLYNKDGELYWNYYKLATGTFINEDSGGLYLGKLYDSDYCNYVDIKADQVQINGTTIVAGPSEVRFCYTSIIVGPHSIKSCADEIQFGHEGVQATSVLFNGPVTFNSGNGVTFNGTISFNGPIRNGLFLASFAPIDTNQTLYNKNGDLYWNGSKIGGSTFNFIEEGADWLKLGLSAEDVTVSGSRSVLVKGPNESQIQLHNYGISIKTNENDSEATIFIQGPGNSDITVASTGTQINNNYVQFGNSDYLRTTVIFSGPVTFNAASLFNAPVELSSLSSHPSNQSYKLYNKDGDLYWTGDKLARAFNYIQEDADGTYIGKIHDSDYREFVNIKADEVQINGTSIVSGPYDTKLHDSTFIVGPGTIMSDAKTIQIGVGTTAYINGSVRMSYPLYLNDYSTLIPGPLLENYKGDLYWNESKVTNSIIEVPYQDVVDEPGKRGSSLTLENNTIYNFDPDHEVDISEINVKPWNTPQLHLYFNNTSSGKTKMTFTYPSDWKWINQSTSPSSSDFKEGYLYCIALRSVANPVYSQSSTTPPYNQQYIVIANIAYEVPVDV